MNSTEQPKMGDRLECDAFTLHDTVDEAQRRVDDLLANNPDQSIDAFHRAQIAGLNEDGKIVVVENCPQMLFTNLSLNTICDKPVVTDVLDRQLFPSMEYIKSRRTLSRGNDGSRSGGLVN